MLRIKKAANHYHPEYNYPSMHNELTMYFSDINSHPSHV